MSTEHRRQRRVAGYAKAIVTDSMTPGYIRDMSMEGCQAAFMQPLPVAEGDPVTIRVIAVHDPGAAPFLLRLRIRWVRSDPLWFLVGGETEPVSSDDAGSLEKLVTYYAGAGS